MPFDAGGTFTRSYNWQADRDAGIKILAQRMDGEFNNYAGGLNQTFLRTGIVPMGGPLNMNSNPIVGVAGGTLISPGIRFESDTDTGFMQSGPGNLTLVVDGVAMAALSIAGGFAVTGKASVSGPLTVSSISATGGLVVTGGIIAKDGPTTGGVSLVSGQTTHTGYLALLKADSSRMGYIGFVPQAGGAISYNNDGAGGHQFDGGGVGMTGNLNVGGVISAGSGINVLAGGISVSAGDISIAGRMTAPNGFYVDTYFYMAKNPNVVYFTSDNGDFNQFDRINNIFGTYIANVENLRIAQGYVQIPGASLLYIGDFDQYMRYDAGPGNAQWVWNGPGGDYMYLNRPSHTLNIILGNTNRLSLSGTMMSVNTHLNVVNNITSTNGVVAVGMAGLGTAQLQAADVGHSGLVAFYRSDGVRHGYLGFAGNPTGSLAYNNDLGGGHQFAGGPIYSNDIIATGVIKSTGVIYPGNDTNFYHNANAGYPVTQYDVSDYIGFDRGANTFNFVIGNQFAMALNAAGPLVPTSGVGGALTDVGYRYHPELTFGSSATLGIGHVDRLLYYNGPGGSVITLPAGIPPGSNIYFINNGTGSITISAGGGTTLYAWTTASGTFQSGNRFMFNSLAMYTFTSFASGSAWLITAPQGGGLA